jgi:hypothetical protein
VADHDAAAAAAAVVDDDGSDDDNDDDIGRFHYISFYFLFFVHF